MVLFGALFHGPCGHHFYKALEKRFPGTSVKAVTLKVNRIGGFDGGISYLSDDLCFDFRL